MNLEQIDYFQEGVSAASLALRDFALDGKRPTSKNPDIQLACDSIALIRSMHVDHMRQKHDNQSTIATLRAEVDDLESQRQLVLTAQCEDERRR